MCTEGTLGCRPQMLSASRVDVSRPWQEVGKTRTTQEVFMKAMVSTEQPALQMPFPLPALLNVYDKYPVTSKAGAFGVRAFKITESLQALHPGT